MAIPVGGLATGLDSESLIQQLVAVERKPVTRLETRKVRFEALAAAFKDLNARLGSLKTKADALKTPATFFARSVSSSDLDVATATATAGTVRGTFTLTTTALAKGSIAAAGTTKEALTDGVAAADGTFRFKLGASGSEVAVPVTTTTTLSDLVTAINDANAGVKASTVNTGTADVPAWKLVLTSAATGASNDIVIVEDDTTLAIANTQTAVDAAFSISGLGAFTRPTNSFADVLEGVTITLTGAGASTDLSLDYDTGATRSKIQALVDGYNDVIRAIDGQMLPVKAADGSVAAGAFAGDAIPRAIRLGLASAAGSIVAGSLGRLAAVGITTQRDGTLAVDSAKLDTALADDPAAVSTLLAGTSTTSGIADLLATRAEAATKSVTGTIAVRQDGITASIGALQKQIDQGLARLAVTERTLRARFVSLEDLVARTQRTGNALLAQLANLPGAQSQ
ncbi:MAG TPA: flagellar filament capping protein FliD [Terriglobales bacterium]|nr:flagellar filament capping protein FliD [Terriglobales bacterium]